LFLAVLPEANVTTNQKYFCAIDLHRGGQITYNIQTECGQDDDCSDGNDCTIDTCNNGTCIYSPQDDCCGNGICEDGEQLCEADCGPFELIAPPCNTQSCWIPPGLMFDISAINSIFLNGLSFRVFCQPFPGCTVNDMVTVYTASGSYNDHYNDSSIWTEVTRQSISAEREYEKRM
jgi:hypothetical protein